METTNKQRIIDELNKILKNDKLEKEDRHRIEAKIKALENNEIVTK